MTVAVALDSCWPSGDSSTKCRSCSTLNSGVVTRQAADEREMRMMQRKLCAAEARDAAADDGELLTRTRVGGVR